MPQIAVRIDNELKEEATKVFKGLGLDMTTAIKLFLIQSVKTKSIPFQLVVNPSDYDSSGRLITPEQIEEATRYVKEYTKKQAIQLDGENPDHEKLLFDEDW